MATARGSRTRLIVILLIALALLLAVAVSIGGGSSSTSPGTAIQTGGPIVTAPVVQISTQHVGGHVSVQVKHLGIQSWRFVYAVRNTGPIPIAGFQIDSGRSHLFNLRQPAGWAAYGAGVCGGRHPGILVYWSTTASGLHTIPSNATRHFSFLVRTARTRKARYSVSWRSAQPDFGQIRIPAPSSLPPGVPCHTPKK